MDRYIAFILVILLSPADAQASYFNTDRPQKIMGSFLTEVEHIDEVAEFSNAFGFAPKSVDEITRYLDANVHKMLPVISIGKLLFDPGTGVWNTMQALEAANPIGRKLFLVPGGFLADKLFDDVETLVDQLYLNAYLLNQSKEIGGLGVFLWGDMIEDGRFFTGARNIRSIVDLINLIAQFFGVGKKTSF